MNLELQTLGVKNNQPLHKFFFRWLLKLITYFLETEQHDSVSDSKAWRQKDWGTPGIQKFDKKKKYLCCQSHLLQIIIREDSWVSGDGAELEVVGKSEDDGEDDPRSSQQQTRSQPSKIAICDQNSYGALSLDTRYITVKQCWWHFL